MLPLSEAGSSRGRVPRASSCCCERRSGRRTNPGRSLKKRPGPVGAGRPTGWNGSPGPPVATRASSSHVLHAHANATTANGDTRLIILSLHVAAPGVHYAHSWTQEHRTISSARRVCRYSRTVYTSGVDRARSSSNLRTPHCVSRRELSLPYTFDGFRSVDDFLVIEMNYAFDCILGIPWLARYQPEVDWLARSVKRRSGFDVSEVFTHLLVAPRDWPHVTVVDKTSTTQAMHRVSDGPLCTACSVLLDDVGGPTPSRMGQQRTPSRGENETVVEHGFSPKNEMVVEREFPSKGELWVPTEQRGGSRAWVPTEQQ
ncbi:LOW QUALITY PROTEIN: polyprotein, partial [Phytophthora megakarya]